MEKENRIKGPYRIVIKNRDGQELLSEHSLDVEYICRFDDKNQKATLDIHAILNEEGTQYLEKF